MSAPIAEIGVGGIFALLVIDKVLIFVGKKNGKKPSIPCVFREETKAHMQETHDAAQAAKRIDGALTALTTEATKQTTLLEVIAANGSKR